MLKNHFIPDPEKKYYMFYKPVGCITARSDPRHKTVMHYLDPILTADLHPLGRLDKDTEGLLLLTNDGQFTNYLMSPENHISKTYEFIVLGNLSSQDICVLEQGIHFIGSDKITAPCQIKKTGESVLHEISPVITEKKYRKLLHHQPEHPVTFGTITITEGRKHHVKRLLKHVQCYVVALKRISIGALCLDESLKPGEYRELNENDFLLL